MKGGLTYMDMDERKEAAEFLAWLKMAAPETFTVWWENWKRSRAVLAAAERGER